MKIVKSEKRAFKRLVDSGKSCCSLGLSYLGTLAACARFPGGFGGLLAARLLDFIIEL